MATLHLLPPYLPEDVQQAYRTLVRQVHPDVGGSIEEFLKIQRAYEQAQTYLEFRASRREWIAARVDRYQRTEQVLGRLRALGAEATVEAPDWLERSFGEFAQFMETIESIRLHNSPQGNDLIELLLMERPVFDGLRTLSLAGSKVSDAFARRLRVLGSLKHLDLRRTAVSNEVATLAEELQDLEICERLTRESWPKLSAIVVTPTRALVNDLFLRLERPVHDTGIRIGRKTADHSMSSERREQLLITTPESLESLLTFNRDVLADLRALVIDEIHLLDGSPRGDQLRCIINRLSAFLAHARPEDSGLYQRVALSATVSDPQRIASAYLGQSSSVISVPGQREIEATFKCVPGDDQARAHATIEACSEIEDVRKVLVFVNSRQQVDRGANYFKYGLFANFPIYGHHGSLSKHEREKVEEKFRSDNRAVCIATMTLEVGIDIGDIDLVVCIDPPFSLASFLQRIGRGCRRRNGKTRVLCMARNRVGQLVFEAYVQQSRQGVPPGPTAPMRRSVLIQQILAYLRQVKYHRRVVSQFLNVFESSAAPAIPSDVIQEVLADMESSNLLYQRDGVVVPAQDGWDFIESNRIYSNISPSQEATTLIDIDTGQSVAVVQSTSNKGVLVAGRSYDILPGSHGSQRHVRLGGQHDEPAKYGSSKLPYAFDVGASLRSHLGISRNQLVVIPLSGRIAVMTWLGSLFNSAIKRSLEMQGHRVSASSFALKFDSLDLAQVTNSLRNAVDRIDDVGMNAKFKPEQFVDMGPHVIRFGERSMQNARMDWMDKVFLSEWVEGISDVVWVDPDEPRAEDIVALAAS